MPRPSSIDKLPEAARERLHTFLRDPSVSQIEATDLVNALLEQMGSDQRLSKSAVNRYAMRMEDVGARLRQSREVASLWIGDLGNQPQGKVGQLLNEIVRTLAFETTMHLADGDKPVDPSQINKLALAVQRLEGAASLNQKREREIREEERKRVAEQAAKAAETEGRAQGASPDAIAAMQAAIMRELSA